MLIFCVLCLIAGASFASFRHAIALAVGGLGFGFLITLSFGAAQEWPYVFSGIAFAVAVALFQLGYLGMAMLRHSVTPDANVNTDKTKSRVL